MFCKGHFILSVLYINYNIIIKTVYYIHVVALNVNKCTILTVKNIIYKNTILSVEGPVPMFLGESPTKKGSALGTRLHFLNDMKTP